MYSVMIVDDEEIVRNGLVDLICWNDYDFNVCMEAVNGRDAFEKIVKNKPDLVITDVKMPGMSGLDLIEKVNEEDIKCNFIILSGYSEFEYAKKAMNYGINHYLLKPIDEDELIESLESIKKQLDKKAFFSKETVQEELLRQVLLNIKDYDELEKDIEYYDLDLNYNLFCVAVINISKDHDNKVNGNNMKKLSYFVSTLENTTYLVMEDRAVLVCKGVSYEKIKEQLLESNELMYKMYNKKYFVCLGHDVRYLKDITFSYECAKMLQNYRFMYSKKEVLTMDIFLNGPKINISSIDFSEVCMLVEATNIHALKHSLDGIKNFLEMTTLDETAIKLKIIQNMIAIQNKLEKNYSEYKLNFLNMDHVLGSIYDAVSVEQLFDVVYNYCVTTSQILYNSSSTSVVKRIYTFMEKNYNTDLKLEKIAKIFNYNKAYLGKLIKQEKGDYFNNLLDYIRINKAKEFLEETNLKVYQISEKVGYCTLDYFYIKFKKYTGISPTEYRAKTKENYK